MRAQRRTTPPGSTHTQRESALDTHDRGWDDGSNAQDDGESHGHSLLIVCTAMIVSDVIHDPSRRTFAARPEMDPLTEEGALQEAALVDMRLIAAESILAVLFDLRMALQLRMGNTAILVARGVRELEWGAGAGVRLPRIWYAVVGSAPDTRDGRFALTIGLAPDAELRLVAAGAEFFVGDVPHLNETPPDFTVAGAEEIAGGIPSWESTFVPSFGTFLDPVEAR